MKIRERLVAIGDGTESGCSIQIGGIQYGILKGLKLDGDDLSFVSVQGAMGPKGQPIPVKVKISTSIDKVSCVIEAHNEPEQTSGIILGGN